MPIKLISSNGELIQELADSTTSTKKVTIEESFKSDSRSPFEFRAQAETRTQSEPTVRAQSEIQAQSDVETQPEEPVESESPEEEIESQPEPEVPSEPEEMDSLTEAVMLAEMALNQAQDAIDEIREQIKAINEEKAQIIESNDFDKIDYINEKVAALNAELAQRLDMVASANQVAKDTQLAIIDSADLTSEEKFALINQLKPVELNTESDSNVKELVLSTETSEPATLGDIVISIGNTIWDFVKELPTYIAPAYEIFVQVVVGAFGALGLFIPHAIVGAIKLIAKIPTFISLAVEFVSDGMLTVKSAIESVLTLFPMIKEGFGFIGKVLGTEFTFEGFFTSLQKGIAAFIEDFANFLDERTKLTADMDYGYVTIGIHEFVGNFAELITKGLLNFVDAINKGIATAVDSSKEVALWYQENFEPVWEAFQTALSNLVESISKLISIPITAVLEVITSFVLVANESAMYKIKQLIGEQIDLILDNVAKVLHNIASFIGNGIDKLVIKEVEDITQETQNVVDSINNGEYQTETAKLMDLFSEFTEVNKGKDLTQLDEATLVEMFNDFLDTKGEVNFDELLSDTGSDDINLDEIVPEEDTVEVPSYDDSTELPQTVNYNLEDDISALPVAA